MGTPSGTRHVGRHTERVGTPHGTRPRVPPAWCRLGASSAPARSPLVPARSPPVPARSPPVPARSPPVPARCRLGPDAGNVPSGAGSAPTGVTSVPVHFMFTQIKYHLLPTDQSISIDSPELRLHPSNASGYSDLTCASMRDPRAASPKINRRIITTG